MVNIPYRSARLQGAAIRSIYTALLPYIRSFPIPQTCQVPIAIYSFSCQQDLPEQVASIRSFLRYVGIPKHFTVVSDGSYTEFSCKLICQIHPCVQVVDFNKFILNNLPQCIYDYISLHPLGKKLAVLISLPVDGATIFTDSDVLFFPGAAKLIDLAMLKTKQPQYLLDCQMALDPRLIKTAGEKLNPVNSGFIFFNNSLDWSVALERLVNLQDKPTYFTEQTLVHLTLHYHQASAFCSEQFVVQIDDFLIYADKYASEKLVLRHYVKPVRHKFWFNVKF